MQSALSEMSTGYGVVTMCYMPLLLNGLPNVERRKVLQHHEDCIQRCREKIRKAKKQLLKRQNTGRIIKSFP